MNPLLDCTTTTTSMPRRARLLATLALAFGCSGDDAAQGDGGSSVGTTSSVATTSDAGSTHGASTTSDADSTPGASTTGNPGTGSSTDPTATDSTGAPPVDACACAVPYPSVHGCSVEDLNAWVPGCPEAPPCSRLTVECSRPGVDLYDCRAELAYDEAAMQCALEALRDGTPSWLEIDGLDPGGLFTGQSLYVIHVLEGRMAVQAGCQFADAGAYTYGPDLHALADPSHFTACMDVASPAERYQCMLEGLGEGTMLPECPG